MKINKSNLLALLLVSTFSYAFGAQHQHSQHERRAHQQIPVQLPHHPIVMPPLFLGTVGVFRNSYTGEIFQGTFVPAQNYQVQPLPYPYNPVPQTHITVPPVARDTHIGQVPQAKKFTFSASASDFIPTNIAQKSTSLVLETVKEEIIPVTMEQEIVEQKIEKPTFALVASTERSITPTINSTETEKKITKEKPLEQTKKLTLSFASAVKKNATSQQVPNEKAACEELPTNTSPTQKQNTGTASFQQQSVTTVTEETFAIPLSAVLITSEIITETAAENVAQIDVQSLIAQEEEIEEAGQTASALSKKKKKKKKATSSKEECKAQAEKALQKETEDAALLAKAITEAQAEKLAYAKKSSYGAALKRRDEEKPETQQAATQAEKKEELRKKMATAKQAAKNGGRSAQSKAIKQRAPLTPSESLACATPTCAMTMEEWEYAFENMIILGEKNPKIKVTKAFLKKIQELLAEPCISSKNPLRILKEAQLINLEMHPTLPSCTITKCHTVDECEPCRNVQDLCTNYKNFIDPHHPLLAEIEWITAHNLQGGSSQKKVALTRVKEIEKLLIDLEKILCNGYQTDDSAHEAVDSKETINFLSQEILKKIKVARLEYPIDEEIHGELNAQEIALIFFEIHPNIPLCTHSEPHENQGCSCEKIVALSISKEYIKCVYYFIIQLVQGKGIKEDIPHAKLLLQRLAEKYLLLATKLKNRFPVFADVELTQ